MKLEAENSKINHDNLIIPKHNITNLNLYGMGICCF